MNERFIFSHVPKAAGTTMGRILKRNFGSSFYSYYGLYDHHMFTADEVGSILRSYPQYRCIASHMFSLRLPYDSQDCAIRAFAFVRHPLDRVVSLYHYAIKLCQDNPGSKHPGSMEEFYGNLLRGNEEDRRFFNGQLHFLSGGGENALPVDELLELSVKNRVLIAPTDQFDDACMLLERWYPESFRDASYPGRQNAAPREQEIPASLEEKILEANALDLELFTKVSRIFGDSIRKEFSSDLEVARADYARRCAETTSDWIAEDETVALTKEERNLLEFLKKENRSLHRELEFLRSLPLAKLGPVKAGHVAAIWRRWPRKEAG